MNIEIEKLCNWSAPKRVKTARGERDLLTAQPTEAFKAAFGSSKRPGPAHQQLRDAGLGWGQDRSGQWVVNWWRPVDPVAAKAEQQVAPAPAAPEAADTALDAALAAVAGKLLPYQVLAVKVLAKALETHGGALDASDTGTGKTYVSLAACAALGKPVFVVCPKAVIPSWKRAATHFGIALAGIGNYEMLRRGTDPVVKIVADAKGKDEFVWALSSQTIIIFDECHRCFKAGTLVNTVAGQIPIEQIVENKLKTSCLSVNLSTDEQQYRNITGYFKFPSKNLVKVRHERGAITCTSDHKFWCVDVKEWRAAASLEGHSLLVLRQDGDSLRRTEVLLPSMLLEGAPDTQNADMSGMQAGVRSKIQESESDVVLSEVFSESKVQECKMDSAAFKNPKAGKIPEKGFRKYEEGDAGPAIKTKKIGYAENDNQQSSNQHGVEANQFDAEKGSNVSRTRRKRKTDETAGSACNGIRMKDGISNFNGGSIGGLPTDVLQSGREQSQKQTVEIFGQEEGSSVGISRVVGVEVLEQGSGRQFEGCGCKCEFVYCIEVEDNHNFFANGVLVANCKDHKTLNNKLGMAALRQGYKVIGLSATAADNPTQMKFAARLTKQIADERQFFGWMMRNGVIRGRFGLEFTGGKRVLADLHHRIFPAHGSRLRIADLGDAFPETQIATESFDMNGVAAKIQAAYDDMADEIAALEEREASDRDACILTARLRARQRSEILKAPAIAQLAEDQIEEGMSVAVFVNFDDVLDAVANKLGTKCVVRGGQTAEEREANVAAFQADRSHVIVCNIKAGGVGISLHGNPSARMRYSIICPSDSSQDMKQALGRVWRANGAKSIQRIFLAAGTIEEKVYANAVEKIGRIDALNDGDGNPKPETQPEAEAQPQPQPALVTSITVPDAAPASVAPQTPVAPVSEALREFVHAGLRRLAGMDTDHAKVVNGVGFSKMDKEFGHILAMRARLSDKMAWAAARLCNRYRGQLGGDDYKVQLDALTGGAK